MGDGGCASTPGASHGRATPGIDAGGGGGGGGLNSSDSSDIPAFVAQKPAVHQLQALLCLTLTQLCRWGLESPGAPGKIYCVEKVLHMVQELPFQSLRELVAPVMREASLEVQQADVNAKWEAYRFKHFGGRLLPGCCNLACTSLEGFSEVGMDTQLCGGCKQARYCCRACQMFAWREGGHKTVCRK